MKKDSMDKLFEYIYKNQGERIEDLKDIPIPPMNKVMNKFNESVSKKYDMKKGNKYLACKKVSVIAAILLITFISSIVLHDIPQAPVLKFNIKKQISKVENCVKNFSFSCEK